MKIHRNIPAVYVMMFCVGNLTSLLSGEFQADVQPLLKKYCAKCHEGDDATGEVDFSAINSAAEVEAAFETWKAVIGHLRSKTMPPADELQPTDAERESFFVWYREFIAAIEPRPAVFRPRRLSVTEYRNTLRSVFGFDLEVAVIEAEQTITERSLVVKLLPTDPPGRSGFKNDTHGNPLSTNVWDQYSYLVDAALESLFSPRRIVELQAMAGTINAEGFTRQHADRLLSEFAGRTQRRTVSAIQLSTMLARLPDSSGDDLMNALKLEMKVLLMSPSFIYRGLMMPVEHSGRQPVDDFELAERLSYFVWADAPDQQLLRLAEAKQLHELFVLSEQVDRLLSSPKARSLAEVFGAEWLTLAEIQHVSDNPPQMVALQSQPLDFLNYLFTEDRPLLELIDSQTAFVNVHTASMYGADSRQLKRYVKQKGIEVEIVPNQKITLEHTTERGGILTMPGILAMNRGPILRGTWMLERILGEELPDPPANVGQVARNNPGENLTFRQRFEQHRSNATCALCHDKVDPLGFAVEAFDNRGRYLLTGATNSVRNRKGKGPEVDVNKIDTSGQLPSGEKFAGVAGLKKILKTSQREAVIRNIVERTMAYALCRKLEVFDRPTIDSIVQEMMTTDGTWRDLFHAVCNSISFRETIIPERSTTAIQTTQ